MGKKKKRKTGQVSRLRKSREKRLETLTKPWDKFTDKMQGHY